MESVKCAAYDKASWAIIVLLFAKKEEINRAGGEYLPRFSYGVKSMICVMHVPLGPELAHKMILALSRCPVGLYVNAAELTVCVAPGERLSSVFDAVQPFLFVKFGEYRGRVVPVTVSVTNKAMKSKAAGPVLFIWNSTHQPVPGQLSIPL